ncbi:radical SAM protein [Candidatus Marinimicrobia bacterium MT.SAG.3]|nr:radical SAM protein [Candidatus Neomarinimicrobiota bacterium]TFB09485.1 radical SAM protein [Candidatus Marinimicrobia bacterium MT.SAG.3]
MLKISEIYSSIQGESSYQGLPCVFVRLTGCNLRCSWCDTAYAFFGGEEMSIDEILNDVKEKGISLVEITGGEPLIQEECYGLMTALCDEGMIVLLETGGSIDTVKVDERVKKIIDFKAPSSLMVDENDWNNVSRLTAGDELKFVIGDRADYDWSLEMIKEYELEEKTIINLSPVHNVLQPADLVKWVLEDGLDVRVNLQLHKYIWGEKAMGV